MVCKGIMFGWYKDGWLLLFVCDLRVNIIFVRENDRILIVLVVERFLVNDFGIYICEVIDCIIG